MKTLIPNPIPFLTQLPDPRNPDRIKHTFDTFWKIILTPLSTGCQNILEISKWIHDNQQILLDELELRTVDNQAVLPSQASIYPFLWLVELQPEPFEQLLLNWLKLVLNKLDSTQELIGVNLDGKYLLGTKRTRAGERSFVLLGAFINILGVMLTQTTVTGTETQTAKSLIPMLKTMFNTGSWLVTMDAAVTEQDRAKKIVKADGHFLMQIKKNQFEAWQMLHWVFHYPIDETRTMFVTMNSDHARRCILWSRNAVVNIGFGKPRPVMRCLMSYENHFRMLFSWYNLNARWYGCKRVKFGWKRVLR
jgi:hypothetical protein